MLVFSFAILASQMAPGSVVPRLPCAVCEELSNHHCPKCKTPYCSKACQRLDWKKRGHKDRCDSIAAQRERPVGMFEGWEPDLSGKKKAPPVVKLPPQPPTKTAPPVPRSGDDDERKAPGDFKELANGTTARGACPICLEQKKKKCDLTLCW